MNCLKNKGRDGLYQSISDIAVIDPMKREISDLNDDIDVSFVPMSNVTEQGELDSSETKKLGDVRKSYTYFKEGDVLFAKITPCMENGKGCLAINLVNNIGFGSSEFYVLRPKEGINGLWLYYLTKSDKFRTQAENSMTGSSGHRRVQKHFFDKYKVYVPGLEEQEKIAHILDQSKEIISKRKAQIEILDNLIDSKFYSMFGDVSKGEVFGLKKYINIIGGNAFSSKGYRDIGIPIIKIGTVNKGYFDESNIDYWDYDESLEKYKLLPDDLLITLTGTVGKDDYGNVLKLPKLYDYYYLNQRVAKLDIISSLLDKEYLMHCLRQPNIKNILIRNNRGVRQANISNNDIYNLQVKIPPIELQNQFAEIVNKIEKEKELLKRSLEQLEINFKALEQKAFNGELFN